MNPPVFCLEFISHRLRECYTSNYLEMIEKNGHVKVTQLVSKFFATQASCLGANGHRFWRHGLNDRLYVIPCYGTLL